MAISKFDAMHQTRGAINNLLDRYEKLGQEGNHEAAAFPILLIELHRKHAGELLEHLSALGYSTDGDSPEAVGAEGIDVPDPAALATLANGEAALLAAYNDALVGWPKSDSPEVYDMIENQYTELRRLLETNP